MIVEAITNEAGKITGFVTVMTTAKGKEVRTEYAAVTRRAVEDLVHGVDAFDHSTRCHFTVGSAQRIRNARSAGRKDAISTLNL
jgi:hypothetical protein